MSSSYRVLYAALILLLASPAVATAGETNVELGLGPLVGTHAEPGVLDTVAPVPIPIFAVSHRASAVEVFAEGLPLSPPILLASGYETITTNLTFENVLVRGYAFHDRVSVGIGETIYNQSSRYQPFDAHIDSRVVGGRYELAGLPLANKGFRVALDLVPVLVGNIIDEQNGRTFKPHFERGSQSEFSARYRRTFAHAYFEYGARYINYVAHLQPYGELADRNVGFRPYASFGVRL